MRLITTHVFLLCMLLASTASVRAQIATHAEAPMHEHALGDVRFMHLTDFGNLVVGHGGRLAGIDPTQAQPVFDFSDFGTVTEEELVFVPGTPCMLVSGSDGAYANIAVASFQAMNKRFKATTATQDAQFGGTLFYKATANTIYVYDIGKLRGA